VIFACSKTYAPKPTFENRTQNWMRNSESDYIEKKCGFQMNPNWTP